MSKLVEHVNRSEKFWDRTAEKYAASQIRDPETYEKKLELTRNYLTPDMDILEFGCGTGSTALLHAPHVRHILATDISGEMVRIAQCKAEEQGVQNVTFQHAVLDDLAGQKFDAVLGLNILHLLPNRDVGIAQVYDLLKPGGVFVSSTACLSGKWRLLAPVLAIGRLIGKVPLVRQFSAKALRKSITAGGFTLEEDWEANGGLVLFLVARKPV